MFPFPIESQGVGRRQVAGIMSDVGSLQRNESSSALSTTNSDDAPNIVSIPSNGSLDGALRQIEDLLESILDAIDAGTPLVIPFRAIRTATAAESIAQPSQRRQGDGVRFPGRTIQEAKKFEALFRIIELTHEALLSGTLITKRNIYYQNPDLFKSQSVVDEMVDTLAFTLGVSRDDLNIVAAAKGLIAGPIKLIMRDESVNNCGLLSDSGVLLPSISSIHEIAFHSTCWVLVVEKEATFRTLAAAQYPRTSRAGHGIMITAKGFPDLATRKFLSMLQSIRPQLPVYALVDFDPHGIAILRTYKYGSQRLYHESDATVRRLGWLGIRSNDIIVTCRPDGEHPFVESHESQDTPEFSSQESLSHSLDGSQHSARPPKRLKVRHAQDPSELVLPLSANDRKKATEILREISSVGNTDTSGRDHMRELQRMLMLNIKAEIQAVDNYGNLAGWLDQRLCAVGH